MTLSHLEEPVYLACKFCTLQDFICEEELADHMEEEHAYELHDKNCSEFDVVEEGGVRRCGNCFVEWSEV